MSKHRRRDPDPFHDIREWQDHRYDPGYFLGGHIHPVLKTGRRPNPYGYVLIGSGLLSIFFFGGALRTGELWQVLVMGSGGFISVAAGFALLRKRKKNAANKQ
jgi:hypothetical protein